MGVDVSIAQSILTLASALLDENFSQRARTIQYLMGKDVTIDDVLNLIN